MKNEALVPSRLNGSGPVRLLMADPDASFPQRYRGPLSEHGFELATASSGLQCLAQLREHVPDVLVLNPQLPWGGGEGVLAVMGEEPDLASVPVMILASCRNPEILDRVARFPSSAYHLKPLAPRQLVARLRTLLKNSGTRLALAEQTGRLEWSIVRRTGNRVRDLRVDSVDGRVIVRGRVDSHHIKQLALAAVLEAFEASESQCENIELDIEVAASGVSLAAQPGRANGSRFRDRDSTQEFSDV